MIADHIYLKGLQENQFNYFRLAKYFYPFDKDINVSEGLTLIRSRINDKVTYEKLKEALKHDPYSIEMLGMYIQFANFYGKKEEVISSFKILKQIGSNTNTYKELQKLNIPILKGL